LPLISFDGTHIVFDRWRQHADIALMTLRQRSRHVGMSA
jgi:hypothetical protein